MGSMLGIVRLRSRSRRAFENFLHLPQYKLSDNSLLDLLKSSRLNDLTACKRRFNVDNMMLYMYISVRDHARK